MLTIQNLSFHYGGRTIYDGASLQIKPKDRIGLIGLNGTGKTTLLKLIYGMLNPDGGSISKSNDCTLGFLNQDLLSYQSQEPIIDVALQGFQRQLELQHQIDKVLQKMETDYTDDLVNKLAVLQEEFHMLDGYTIHSKAEEILEGLGFRTEDLQKPLAGFSGGWRMRVMLAKLLLQKPALLMLDEPTNHLDLPSIEWLENYISSYEGSVMIVSHDREFLDRAVNTIVEVSGGQLTAYSGNYSFYMEEKSLRNEIQRNAFKNQQQKLKQTERFIERFRSKASKARQVQSKVKMLDKIDRIEEVIEESVNLNIRFAFTQQPGKVIAELKNASKRYGDLTVLENTQGMIERGDKIALIGANGKGKSTLLRMIAGTEKFQGERMYGYNVIQAFYAQHQLESLNIENEILQELKQSGSDKSEMELRNLLGCFLFQGDEVFKKIKVLSGGEKSRVALAKTLISQANFLLLDEPTNHLDMQSVNILIQALQQYQGSFLVVSHDRHFIAHIANKIWYIENQQLKEYPGTYDEYVYWMEQRNAQQSVQTAQPKREEKQEKKEKPRLSNPEETQLKKKLKEARQKLSELENKVFELEVKKTELEEVLAKPSVYGDPYQLAETNQQYEKVSQELDRANQAWEQTAEEIETIEQALS
jgi:ATP-binding cassette subfamily F protein 3